MVIKRLCGRIKNNISLSGFIFGKELQKHVGEFKTKVPFLSPLLFEETMHKAVIEISEVLDEFGAQLLGLGMQPTLKLEETKIWDHRDRQIYAALNRVFNLQQHGWLNIQSFQLNLPYYNEPEAIKLYNALAGILPYIPAIAASSPIYESKFGEFVDNRLHFYWINQARIPSITGDIIPESIDSLKMYRNLTIHRYSSDLMKAKVPVYIINKEWMNSRGAIFRFDRKAIEIRIIDEQECIKSDVALACFIRALLRGLIKSNEAESDIIGLPYTDRVNNLKSIIKNGLCAKISHPKYSNARDLCRQLHRVAYKNATEEEKHYLWIIKKRVENGNLSETILKNVKKRSQKTNLNDAILSIYSKLAEKPRSNEIYE